MKNSIRFDLLALALLTSVGSTVARAQQPAAPVPAVPGAAPGVPGALAPSANYNPARMIAFSPEQKRAFVVRTSERNPYARRSPGEEAIDENGENAEEIEIRKSLNSLSVTGASRGTKGMRILLGDIILEKGRILPELLSDQSENLKVVEVNDDSIVLAWLDIETGEPTGKTMQIGYDLTPNVSYALQGQGGRAATSAKTRMGVLRIGQERKKFEARMAASDPGRKLPEEVYKAGQ